MRPKSSISITFLPKNEIVVVSQEAMCVLDIALKAGIEVSNSCGGNGTCGTCLVRVSKGGQNLSARNEIEMEMALERGFNSNERLSCQFEPVDGLVLEVPCMNLK